jgi:hypothetical protein
MLLNLIIRLTITPVLQLHCLRGLFLQAFGALCICPAGRS